MILKCNGTSNNIDIIRINLWICVRIWFGYGYNHYGYGSDMDMDFKICAVTDRIWFYV